MVPVIDYRIYANFMARWTTKEQARLRELEAAHKLNECSFVDRVRGPAEGQGPFERAAAELLETWISDDVERMVGEPVRCSVLARAELEQGHRDRHAWFAVAGEFEAR